MSIPPAPRSGRPPKARAARQTGWPWRFVVSVLWDLLDMTVGRALIPLPFSGEVAGAAVMVALWGPAGLFYLAEAADVTEQIDGFVPAATIIALLQRDRFADAWFVTSRDPASH